MSDGVLLIVLLVPMALALLFGIWAGLGYPGLYDRYERTGRAPRRHRPWWWVLGSGHRGEAPRRPEEGTDEEEKEGDGGGPPRPDFQKRWRDRRGR